MSADFDQVRRIASDVLGLPFDQETAETGPDTVPAWDSVQHLNLVLALEQSFGMTFEPEELDQMKTLRQIGELIRRKRAGSG